MYPLHLVYQCSFNHPSIAISVAPFLSPIMYPLHLVYQCSSGIIPITVRTHIIPKFVIIGM
jgi:hypothetical protein